MRNGSDIGGVTCLCGEGQSVAWPQCSPLLAAPKERPFTKPAWRSDWREYSQIP